MEQMLQTAPPYMILIALVVKWALEHRDKRKAGETLNGAGGNQRGLTSMAEAIKRIELAVNQNRDMHKAEEAQHDVIVKLMEKIADTQENTVRLLERQQGWMEARFGKATDRSNPGA